MKPWVLLMWYTGAWASPTHDDSPVGSTFESLAECRSRLYGYTVSWADWARRQSFVLPQRTWARDEITGDVIVEMGPVLGECVRRQDLFPDVVQRIESGP